MFRLKAAFLIGLPLVAGCTSSDAEAGDPTAGLPADLADSLEVLDEVTTRVAALESELAIIEERKVYVVLDPDSEELLLKVAGVVLKRVPVHIVIRPEGGACRGGIAVLAAKTPTDLPATTSDEGVVPRVRLEEMPVGYRLEFDCEGERSALVVAPLRDARLERLHALGDRVTQTVRDTVPFVGKTPTHVLYLSDQGAQELYWSLNVGDFAILR